MGKKTPLYCCNKRGNLHQGCISDQNWKGSNAKAVLVIWTKTKISWSIRIKYRWLWWQWLKMWWTIYKSYQQQDFDMNTFLVVNLIKVMSSNRCKVSISWTSFITFWIWWFSKVQQQLMGGLMIQDSQISWHDFVLQDCSVGNVNLEIANRTISKTIW